MRTRIATVHHGVVEINAPQGGIPALRLVQHHAPGLGIEGFVNSESYVIPLGQLDLDHQALCSLNTHHVRIE